MSRTQKIFLGFYRLVAFGCVLAVAAFVLRSSSGNVHLCLLPTDHTVVQDSRVAEHEAWLASCQEEILARHVTQIRAELQQVTVRTKVQPLPVVECNPFEPVKRWVRKQLDSRFDENGRKIATN